MSEHGGNGSTDAGDLTEAVRTARRGFRRDLEMLVQLLDGGRIFVPLAKPIEGAEDGQEIEVDEGFSLSPHMLVDDEEHLYAVLFTRPEMLEPVIDALDWDTDGAPLEFATVPARVGLEMAHDAIDEEQVVGLVLNAMDDTELLLRREELASILAGKAIPLVGYVTDIPEQEFEETLVADTPADPALLSAVENCVRDLDGVTGFELLQTFNAERDREPHATLRIRTTRPEADWAALAETIVAGVKEHVPPPGYIDVVFQKSE